MQDAGRRGKDGSRWFFTTCEYKYPTHWKFYVDQDKKKGTRKMKHDGVKSGGVGVTEQVVIHLINTPVSLSQFMCAK